MKVYQPAVRCGLNEVGGTHLVCGKTVFASRGKAENDIGRIIQSIRENPECGHGYTMNVDRIVASSVIELELILD